MVLKQIVECAVILILFFAALASHPFPENDPTDTLSPDKWRARQMTRYRLPNNTIPWQYYIFIEPNMDDMIFSWNGKVSIDIQVVDPTSVLTLHSHRNLVIYENLTELVDSNGTKLTPVEHDRHNEVEFLNLKFDHEISVGNYSLRLKYKGIDNLDYVGFYNASSRFEVMEPGYVRVVGTHFEATTARQAFPCWDEPGLKARFKVAIKHFSNYTAVSNMPEIDHVNTPDGKILTTFDTTPIMSTYLLTFVIANYENVFNEHRNVSVHTSKNVMHAVTRFMNFSPKVVQVMESYTGFSYGLPRIGSVTLPEYTSAATEHWGLVTYSERFFRDSETKMSLPQKDRIELLIAHELAHSWFGNRVTPLWWDDLWLNEAFATYFQYYIMDQIYDNWGGLGLFIVMNNQELAFPKDTGGGIPIRWTPVSNREIRYLFGPITYKKGAAIVHMFRNVLGDNIFRAGIQKYMAKHSFQAVVADDLMTAFQEAYEENPNKEKPLNVKETMTTWLIQKGYPLINVTRNYTTGDTKVSQISNVFSRNSDKWWIPLTYATKSSLNFSSTSPVSWISNKQEFVNIGGIGKDDWVVFNIQASGYYRVNYDNENWNRLAEYLNTDDYQNIHVLNRATLIDDAFYLAEHQPSDYLRIFYELTKYLKREDEYLPWRTAYNAFKRIEHDLYRTDLHDMFLKYVLGLMHSFVEKIGFEAKDTDNHLTKLARTDLIPWACIAGHFGCSEYAAQRLIKLQENPLKHRLSPDESRWIFCAGLRGLNGSAAQQFNDWAYENEQKLFFATVGCTENHEIHRNILNATLKTNATSETYNAYETFQDLLTSTDENFNFAVNFFLENHQAMNTAAYSTGWRYILDECIDPNGDLVFHIFCGVTARARSEKLKQVLLLQDVMNNLDIPKTTIENSERIIANAARRAAPYRKFWEELSAENSINGSQINPL